MSQEKVAARFAAQASPRGTTGSFWFRGNVAYSYSEPIAIIHGKEAFVTTDKFSSGTSRSTNTVWAACQAAGLTVHRVSFVKLTKTREDRWDHAARGERLQKLTPAALRKARVR